MNITEQRIRAALLFVATHSRVAVNKVEGSDRRFYDALVKKGNLKVEVTAYTNARGAIVQNKEYVYKYGIQELVI